MKPYAALCLLGSYRLLPVDDPHSRKCIHGTGLTLPCQACLTEHGKVRHA